MLLLLLLTLSGIVIGSVVGYIASYILAKQTITEKAAQVDDAKQRCTIVEQKLEEQRKLLADAMTHLARVEQKAQSQEEFKEEQKILQQKSHEAMSRAIGVEQTTHIKNSLNELIKPLQDKIQEFNQTSSTSHGKMESLVSDLRGQLNTFTKSFKTMGDWGEQQLIALLNSHGLREDIDYKYQQCDRSGSKPDFIIKCGGNMEVVIDVKTPLDSYRNYVNSENKEESKEHLRNFVNIIKGHVKDLASKDYASRRDDSLDFVVMYIPMEQALMVALQEDPGLYGFSIGKRILLASTSMIFVLLRTIAHFKQRQQFNDNAANIAKEAGEMINKFAKLVDHLSSANDKIKVASDECEKAVRYINGHGGIMSRIDRIHREYGAPLSGATNLDDTMKKLEVADER